ncbi:MAG TPA: hypothetical protein VL346_09885, partial [Acidobacteriaceae bacterium]|nr:hypothetical protein [Acidobacteriaceae bacterium]
MAKITIVFAVLFIALGLVGYIGTGSQHPTALIPAALGVLLGIFGFLAITPNEGKRKLFMHINVTLGLLGFLGTVMGLVSFVTGKLGPRPEATQSKAAMAVLS